MSNPSGTIKPQSSLPLQKATLKQTVYIRSSQNHFPKHSNTLSLLKRKVKQVFQETKFQEFTYYLWGRILPDSPSSLHLKIALSSLPERGVAGNAPHLGEPGELTMPLFSLFLPIPLSASRGLGLQALTSQRTTTPGLSPELKTQKLTIYSHLK